MSLTRNTQKTSKDLDLVTKVQNPIVNKINTTNDLEVKYSKLYYYIYFLNNTDLDKFSHLNHLKNEKLNDPSLFHQLFYHSINKNYCEISRS